MKCDGSTINVLRESPLPRGNHLCKYICPQNLKDQRLVNSEVTAAIHYLIALKHSGLRQQEKISLAQKISDPILPSESPWSTSTDFSRITADVGQLQRQENQIPSLST